MTTNHPIDKDPTALVTSPGRPWRAAIVVVAVGLAIVASIVVFAMVADKLASLPRVVATFQVPGHPRALLISADGLWVVLSGSATEFAAEPSLVRLGSTGAVDRTVELPGSPGFAVAAGDSIWVSNSPNGYTEDGVLVQVHSPTGHERGGRLLVDGPAGVIAFGGGSLWLMLSGDRASDGASLVQIDPRFLKLVGEPVRVSDARSMGLMISDGAIWATAHEDGQLVRIDPFTHEVRKASVGRFPVGLTSVGGSIWVANRGDGTVSRIDPDTMQTVGGPIRVGQNPTWIASTAGAVWVANQDDGTVSRIDAATGQVVGGPIRVAAPVAGQPAANWIESDGRSLWVSSITEQSISRIDATR